MKRDMSDEDRYWHEDMSSEFAMTQAEMKQVRIDDCIYDLETNFSTDLLVEAFREAEEADLQEINDLLKNKENRPHVAVAMEVWSLLLDVKSKWIAEHAKFLVEDR